jgi:hypothetical protein
MARRKASGIVLTNKDASVVLGMVARDDLEHDIAAWFGVNQGRIADVKVGAYGAITSAKAEDLPPSGPPGVKGRKLHSSVTRALEVLTGKGEEGMKEAIFILQDAQRRYDANEA